MEHTAYQFRLYPNKEQKELFAKTFGCVRFIWNQMLADEQCFYDATDTFFIPTPAKYKKLYPFLCEVDSIALCNAQLNLQAAFKSFFKNPKDFGFPKFKSKKNNWHSYTTNLCKGNIQVTKTHIKLPKVGFVRIRGYRPVPENYQLKSVTVKCTPTGKYYASVLYAYEANVKPIDPKSFIGLDYSSPELYVSSNGEIPGFPKPYRTALKQLAKEQRKLSHMQKGSSNYKKQRRKVALIHEKVANQRKDFLHKQSRQITNVYDCVCVESLNMEQQGRMNNWGKTVHDNGWGSFLSYLEYKLKAQGKRLVKVDRWFPSTQLCHVCGVKNHSVSGVSNLDIREWTCPHCGTHHDRDTNAAINIRNEGMHILGK